MKKIKLCALLLVVIFNLMFVSSCWGISISPYKPSKAYESGETHGDYNGGRRPFSVIAVKSDTNIFDVNDVNIEVYIGLLRQEDTDKAVHFSDEIISINLSCVSFEYIINEAKKSREISILQEIDLKDKLMEESILKNYTFTVIEGNHIVQYNYSEQINIPKDIFENETGEFCIGFKYSKYDDFELKNFVYTEYRALIHFNYQKLDENTVQIEFDYENFKENDKSFSTIDPSIDHIKSYYEEKYNEEKEKIEEIE